MCLRFCAFLNTLTDAKNHKKKSESNGSRSKSVGRGHLGSNFGFCRNIDKETISRHDLIEKDIELLGVRKAKLGQFLILNSDWLFTTDIRLDKN